MCKSERESVIESIGESEKEREQLKTGCEKNWFIIKKDYQDFRHNCSDV